MQPTAIADVFVDGKHVVANKQLVTQSEKAIVEKVGRLHQTWAHALAAQ